MQADVARGYLHRTLSLCSPPRRPRINQAIMFSCTRALFLVLCLIHVTLATTFHPNCTVPPEGTNYVAEPNVRSTLNILWNALYTVFVCTWVIQHLNVPAQEPRVRTLMSLWISLKWMLVTILLPEYLVGKALGDAISLYEFKKPERSKWTSNWTATHVFYANSGGFLLEFPSRWNPTAVNSAQLSFLLEHEVIDPTPTISEPEIKEKGQGDIFAKLTAMLQLLWLVIQLITRKAQNLPSTKIEISALSFALCSLVTYALWFWKPQNPKIPSYIPLKDINCWKLTHLEFEHLLPSKLEGCQGLEEENGLEEEKGLKKEEFETFPPEKKSRMTLETYLASRVPGCFFTQTLFTWKHTRALAKTFPNDRYNWDSKLLGHEYGEWMPSGRKKYYFTFKGEDVGFILGSVILGGCHCIAWNFDFPTPIEQILWRVATIIVIAIMPVYYLLWFGNYYMDKVYDNFPATAGSLIVGWLSFILFGSARLYLFGAAFRDLFYLPPEAFITTWAASFPNFG
jgi:hypothetical protein